MVEPTIPSALQAFASGSKAVQALSAWSRRSKGDARSLVLELKDNLVLLDLAAEDDVSLERIVQQLTTAEYERLAKSGFNFNRLERARIADLDSLRGTDLNSWRKKTTAELIDSIYSKIRDLKIRYPHVGESTKYRWSVRVNNIRKRIWLLLRHVSIS